MALSSKQDHDFVQDDARGVIHRRFTAIDTPFPPAGGWPTDRIHRGRARQLAFRFWLAANAADKVHELKLWGFPEDGVEKPGVKPVERYTGVADELAQLTIKFSGETCSGKNPVEGVPEAGKVWYEGSYISADTYRYNENIIQVPRNVDDSRVLIVRIERLIYGSFYWESISSMDSGATEGLIEAFKID